MSEIRQKDSTSNTFYVLIRSKVSTPVGMGLTGLAYNTAGLLVSYVRDLGNQVAITKATQTTTAAWVSGGFVEVDASDSPGLYRLDVPDAAFTTGAGVKKVRITWTGANTLDDGSEVDLTTDDPYSGGLTAAQIAGAVWDELRSGHVVSGSFGAGVLLASTAVQAIWDALTSALTTAGSIGKLFVDNVNATISSRSTYAGGDTSGTTTLLGRLTSGRATNLDNLDAAVSSRSTYAGADTSGTTTILGRLTSGRATNLDNLNATVSSRAVPADVPTAVQNADALLLRNAKGGSDGPAASSVAAAIAGGFMKISIVGGVLTVQYADGTTAFTRTLTRAQLDAITAAV